MDRESVSLRQTTRWTIVGIAEMDGIFLGIERATSKGKWDMKTNEEMRGKEREGGEE